MHDAGSMRLFQALHSHCGMVMVPLNWRFSRQLDPMPNRLTRLGRALNGSDPMEGFRLLRRVARRLVPEYRFKWPHMAWWQNGDFTRFLERFGELDGLNTDRRWMISRRTEGEAGYCEGVFCPEDDSDDRADG